MTQPTTPEDVYRSVNDLISALRAAGHEKLAGVLDHRLHKVAWTSGSELLEELRSVLCEALDPRSPSKSTLLTGDIEDVLRLIDTL